MSERGKSFVQGAAAAQRAKTTGKSGYSALWDNKKVFFIAVFAAFGGLEYGYQQGVLGEDLVMSSFKATFPEIVSSSGATGWLTSVLQLGGWIGALSAGIFGEVFSRKHTIFSGALWVILGSYLAAGARNGSFLYAGRFFTGLGVGTLSAVGPLYNAELSPPEIRGLIIALQQLMTTVGICVSYWIGYGTNYIGGTGKGQSEWAWRTPMIIQGIPAIILAIGIWFMPFSPRLLVNKNRDAEAIKTLSYLRNLPEDDKLVQIEYREIKADSLFEKRIFAQRFPVLAAKTDNNAFMREFAQYANIFRTKDSFKRTATAGLIMFFQQWSGIDSIIYYAPIIFGNLGLTSTTTSILATGVVGFINVLTTIPAIMFIDKVGRKPLLLAGSTGMFICMLIVGIIAARDYTDWTDHAAAGWTCVVFIWLYISNFAYSWGPASWILIAEIFPLSYRAKGVSIGASSNWMNNFIIAFIVPPMIAHLKWGMYLFFAVFTFASFFYVWFFVPETKGKTLEEMDQVFGSHTSVEDIELLSQIQREVGLLDVTEDGFHGLEGDGLTWSGGEKPVVLEEDGGEKV